MMNEQKEVELEQYKIFIESTEKNSDRRINQNNIYLTINLAFISYICTQSLDFKHNVVVLIVGLIVCAILNQLEEIGLLESEKVGREKLYKNTRLIKLLSEN